MNKNKYNTFQIKETNNIRLYCSKQGRQQYGYFLYLMNCLTPLTRRIASLNHLEFNGLLPDVQIDHRIEFGLPNQMDVNCPETPCRSYETLDGIQQAINSECNSCNPNLDDSSSSKRAMKRTQNLMVDNENDPNRIDIAPNPARSSSIEFGFPEFCLKKLENDTENGIRVSKREQLYQESKEHKSIVKAATFNAICAFCIMIIMIVVVILARYPNFYVVIIFNALVKFQRTFGLLIASVYCFEVVYQLFCESLDDMKNMMK